MVSVDLDVDQRVCGPFLVVVCWWWSWSSWKTKKRKRRSVAVTKMMFLALELKSRDCIIHYEISHAFN